MDETIKINDELSAELYTQLGRMAALLACLEGGNLTLANQFAEPLGISLNGDNGHSRVEIGLIHEEQV